MDVFQIAQHADDLARAQRFYAMLLESEPTAVFDPPGLLFFHVGPVRLLLEQNAASSLIYLRVDDVAKTVERLRAAGVAVVSEPHVIFRHTDDRLGPAGTDELMAFITDSEGNTVGLVSHTPSADPAG
jgi:methylmalonyl-CoA/ethylmalonyl-CoA epimerase